MSFWKFLKKSITFYRRSHLGVILGVAVSTAILLGALVIGDSIRFSLKQLVYDRLGRTQYALQTGDRFFRQELSNELSETLHTDTAPLLQTRGIAIASGGELRVNKVQVVGVDDRFGSIGGAQELYFDLGPSDIIINLRLAKKLNAAAGDELLMRIEKLDAMPQDAPMATDSDISLSQRFVIKAVATEKEFGRFNLKNSQVEPYSAFMSLSVLSGMLELPDKANMLLVAERPDNALSLKELNDALHKSFTLTDAGLSLKKVENNVELRSDRIFLDSSVSQKISASMPDAQPVFTYFVNQFRVGRQTTPYSFVSSADVVGRTDLKPDEMIINRWLANDLNARPGDRLELTYFVIGPMRTLIEDTTIFRITDIVPLAGRYADRDLMPDFPGLSDEENCRDWEAGIPIDYDKIRDKDEVYWDDYRGTPKAFVSLKTAQDLWGNRFGIMTAIRFASDDTTFVAEKLAALLDPVDFGFIFLPVRDQGMAAGEQSVDFAQLFIGLSFFLIIAALLLTGLLFVFGVEQRSQETGLLLAVGFQKKNVRHLILSEGLVLAMIGSLLGVVLGLLYHELILLALKTMWSDIVGTSALRLKIKPLTVFIGVFAGILMSLFSMWLVARRHARQSIADLQKGAMRVDRLSKKKPVISLILAIISVLSVIVILFTVHPGSSSSASSAFFAAGGLLLFAGLAFANSILVLIGQKTQSTRLTMRSIGQRNNARRRLRSLTLIGVLAAGVFITFTVGANRTSPLQNAEKRSAGTGGFALWGESALPILRDLNSDSGQDFYGFEKGDASFVQLKMKEGDDASCLNLNRIANPQVLGVPPEELDQRGAFSFAALSDDVNPEHPWQALQLEYDNDVIPAIADQTVIVWSLGKSVGDTLTYMDETGREFFVRLVGGLANSIFQGNIIISNENFIKKYPSIGGQRVFLVDAPLDKTKQLAQNLSWVFQDQGMDLTPTYERLADFSKVTNTYLSIFMILGGLGLVLGSLGIGIILLRNVMDRRGELAVMRAVGFDLDALHRMILSEHMMLLVIGILVGVLSALIAVLPSLLTPGTKIPYSTIIVTLIAVIASGVLWTWLAARLAMKGELLPALRNE